MFIFDKIDQLKNNGGVLSYIINILTVMVQIKNINSKNVYFSKNVI